MREDGAMLYTTNPIDGTTIAFQTFGSGVPIVLVHGSGLSQAIWRGFGYVAALRDEFQVVTIDMRGHGRSDKPIHPDDYRMPAILGDIIAVLDQLAVPAAHYLGYSFGARAGFSLIDERPDRVLSFISAGGSHRAPVGSVAALFFEGYDTALARGGMAEFVSNWGLHTGVPIEPQTAAAFLANDPVALRAFFQRLEVEPGITDARLPALQTPTMLLAGSLDWRRQQDSELAAMLMPHARFHSLPGRDHGSTLRPSAEILDLLIPFIRAPYGTTLTG